MSPKLLLEYILEPELIFLASELFIAERPLRRRRMKSGAFSALVKERNHSLNRPASIVETTRHPCSSIPIGADRTITNIYTSAKSDRNDYYRRIQANSNKCPYCISYPMRPLMTTLVIPTPQVHIFHKYSIKKKTPLLKLFRFDSNLAG
jgi:hypothetical protein